MQLVHAPLSSIVNRRRPLLCYAETVKVLIVFLREAVSRQGARALARFQLAHCFAESIRRLSGFLDETSGTLWFFYLTTRINSFARFVRLRTEACILFRLTGRKFVRVSINGHVNVRIVKEKCCKRYYSLLYSYDENCVKFRKSLD